MRKPKQPRGIKMCNYFDAIIFATQTPYFPSEGLDILTPQLFRTAKYCCDKDLVILKTFLEYDPDNNKETFYQMINYINMLHRTIAVVFDSAECLPTHDFEKIVMLDLLFALAAIEIHLVKENVSIIDIKNKDELKLWSAYTHTNPEQMKWVRDGIYLHRDLKLDLYHGLKTNLV